MKSYRNLHRSVARLKEGVTNPKERPTLPLPWSLNFTLKIFPNKEIKEQEIKNVEYIANMTQLGAPEEMKAGVIPIFYEELGGSVEFS